MQRVILLFVMVGCAADVAPVPGEKVDMGRAVEEPVRSPVAAPRPPLRDAGMVAIDAGGAMPAIPSSFGDLDGGLDEDEDASVASDRPPVWYEGGDGSSCETAVVIRGAMSEFQGINLEHYWLKEHYPGYMLLEQRLARCGEHWVDIMQILTPTSRIVDVYFVIDEFFGMAR